MRAKLMLARSMKRRILPRETMMLRPGIGYVSSDLHHLGRWGKARAKEAIHPAKRPAPRTGAWSAVETATALSVAMRATRPHDHAPTRYITGTAMTLGLPVQTTGSPK